MITTWCSDCRVELEGAEAEVRAELARLLAETRHTRCTGPAPHPMPDLVATTERCQAITN